MDLKPIYHRESMDSHVSGDRMVRSQWVEYEVQTSPANHWTSHMPFPLHHEEADLKTAQPHAPQTIPSHIPRPELMNSSALGSLVSLLREYPGCFPNVLATSPLPLSFFSPTFATSSLREVKTFDFSLIIQM